MKRPGKYVWLAAFILLAGLSVGLAAKAGNFLIVDAPRRSDVILVLAGETDRRPQRALELLGQGYGRRIVLDVPTKAKLYKFTQIELAQNYVQDLPQAASVTVCPIDGLSTKDESKDAEKCLQREGAKAKSVLIVTSDFHTRRALDVFRREIPGHEYSVAAARNDEAFGGQWWTHRQWAKTFVDEWLRLIWWKVVDQWR
ncbi:MAG: ElyC/SanA/YdcF family protein [Candidatus Sulfotelmatobacter sp.]